MAPEAVSQGSASGGEVSWPRRRSHVEERRAGEDLVLYDPAGGRLHVLNATAAAIWRLCDGSLPAPAIAGRFSTDFRVDPGQDPPGDARLLLRSLFEAGLIEEKAGDHGAASAEAPKHDGKQEVDSR
jgi:hypothetical protein